MAREERPGDVSDKAAIELGPIVARLRERVDVDDETWTHIVKALTQAMMAGVRIGGAEVAAQAIERGMPVTLKMDVRTSGEDDE